jgi:putative FmdB family regulatory protein
MPTYTFECEECNVEFERALKMDVHLTHECPSCSGQATRMWDADALSFAFKGVQAGATANTGVHADDYPTADRVVGKDAEARWAEIHERNRVKDAARAAGGTHALIRHNHRDYIDYEPMTDGGRTARRNLTKHALGLFRAERAAAKK